MFSSDSGLNFAGFFSCSLLCEHRSVLPKLSFAALNLLREHEGKNEMKQYILFVVALLSIEA